MKNLIKKVLLEESKLDEKWSEKYKTLKVLVKKLIVKVKKRN